MQLMPATARRLGVTRPFDPKENIRGGAAYLAELAERFGEHAAELSSPPTTPASAPSRTYGGIPPYRETRAYVRRVLSFWTGPRGPAVRRLSPSDVPDRPWFPRPPRGVRPRSLAYLSPTRAPRTFVAYPFLADVAGLGARQRPLLRLVATSRLLRPPYLVTGLLLFLADVGVSAAAPLWSDRGAGPPAEPPPESRWAFLVVSLTSALVSGCSCSAWRTAATCPAA